MTNYRQTTRHADKIRAIRTARRQKPAKHSGQPSAAREALRRLSAKIRAAMQTGGLPAAFAGCLTINDCLRRGYQIQTRQSDFDTFAGWRARGYAVDKGAKGYPIWSKPRNHGGHRRGGYGNGGGNGDDGGHGNPRQFLGCIHIFRGASPPQRDGRAPRYI